MATAINTGPIGGQQNTGTLQERLERKINLREQEGLQQASSVPLAAGAGIDLPIPNTGIVNGNTVGQFVEESVIPSMEGSGQTAANIAENRDNSSFNTYQPTPQTNKRFIGNNPETGLPMFEDVTEPMFNVEAAANSLPATYELLNNPELMFGADDQKSVGTMGGDQMRNVAQTWSNTSKFISDDVNKEPQGKFATALSKLFNPNDSQSQSDMVEAMGVITSLAGAATVKAQDRYTVGREEADPSEAYYIDPQLTDDGAAVQVGLSPADFMKATGGSIAKLLQMKGVDVSRLTPTDRDAMGAKVLEMLTANGSLVETTSRGKVKLTPSEGALMSPLGDMADDLMGTNLKAGVSTIPLRSGTPIGLNRDTSQLSGNNSLTEGNVGNIVNELAKDTLGNVALGIDEVALKLVAMQVTDLMRNMVTPIPQAGGDTESRLHYNASKFKKAFKMDQDSIKADYRYKLFNLSDNPSQNQKEAVLKEMNKLTEQRLTTAITRLNEQIKLLTDGYESSLNNFYNSYSTGGMNGRMLPNTYNGNYTGDKEIARNVHKAKINPRININKETWSAHDAKVNAAANRLMSKEGNNDAWEKELDNMPEAIAAEISFRTVLAGKALKKILSKQPETYLKIFEGEIKGGLKLNQEVRNLSLGMLYKGYTRLNKINNDPLYVINTFAASGRRLQSDLDSVPDVKGTLGPLSVDKNSTGRQKQTAAASEWGSYGANSDMAYMNLYTNERGEMRSELSLRLNALKYMNAYNSEPGATNNFELDFEVELDSTQSGPLLQSVIAPNGKKYQDVQDRLGFATNTTRGDLRDYAREEFENGNIAEKTFPGDVDLQELWTPFITNAFNNNEKGNLAREFLLKQPQMQYFYGKPGSMFMDQAAQFEANFSQELTDFMPDSMDVPKRRENIRALIESMLKNEIFDIGYSKSMKHMAMMLASTNSDLVIQGPHGPINLSIGSMQHVIDMEESLSGEGGVEGLKLQMIDIYNAANDETKQYSVMERSFNPSTAKPINYNPTQPISGNNLRTGPAKKLQDSIGVLLVHQLDAAMMNFTIAHVNRNQKRHNPFPAKVIYDAIITNGAGFLRYSHTYNNVSIPSIRQWDLQKSMADTLAKAKKKIVADIKANPEGTVPIGVIEGEDGQASPVSFHSAVTGWLDRAVQYENPNRDDYPELNNAEFELKKKRASYNSEAISFALDSGYIRPEFTEGYREFGVINPGETLVINAGERVNMRMKAKHYANLLNLIETASNSHNEAKKWLRQTAENRVAQMQEYAKDPKPIGNLSM